MSWDALTEEQKREARKVAAAFHAENPRTLPTYDWMRTKSKTAATLPHNKLIAFGRVVLDTCKAMHK